MPKLKQSEIGAESLLRQEDLLDFVENAVVGLHWVAADGTILWANQAELDMLGYSEDEYVGRHISGFHADEPVIEDILSRLKTGEELRNYEARLKAKDGSTRCVLISSNGRFDEGGLVHTRCFTFDVTAKKRLEETQRFMNEAGDIIGSSLDYEQTLRNVAKIAVPKMADWCAIDIIEEDGTLKRLCVEHTDPKKLAYAMKIIEKYPRKLEPDQGVGLVLRTGEPLLYSVVPQKLLEDAAVDEEHLRFIHELEINSAMLLALVSRGNVYGIFTFISAEPGRYRQEDLEIAQQLASRAGTAIDNARLYTSADRELQQRRSIEAALRESEERLALALESGRMGVWECDLLSGAVKWNPTLERLFGLEPGVFEGTHDDFMKRVHPEDRNQVEEAIAAATPEYPSYQMEFKVLQPNGTVRWFAAKGTVSYDSAGKAEHITGMCWDITDRVEAEQKLRMEHAFRQSLEDSLLAGVAAVDPDGRQIYVNASFCRMVGYSEEELLGRTAPFVYWPEEDLEKIEQSFAETLRGEVSAFELKFCRKDGSRFDVLIMPSQLLDGDGRLLGWVASVTDITERKAAEDALFKRERESTALIENAPDIISRFDRECRHLFVNKAVENATGIPAREFIGKSWTELGMPDDLAKMWRKTVLEVFESGRESAIQYSFPSPDGIQHFHGRIVPEFSRDGSIESVFAVNRDITDLKIAEERLHLRIAELQQVYELSTTVTRAEDLEGIFAQALNGMKSVLKVDRSAILLYDDEGVMRFVASDGLSDAYREMVEGHSPWDREDADADPQPVLMADVREEPSLEEYAERIIAEGIYALGFFPLLYEGQLLGKLMVYYDKPHEFTESEVQLARTITNTIAFAIERKRGEEAVSLYRQIFNKSVDGIAIIDLKGRYVEQNAAHADALGYELDEIAGQTPAVHMGQEKFDEIVGELIETGVFRGEVRSLRKDGGAIELDLSAFAVQGDDGQPLCYVGIKRDVTARKRAEEAQRASDLRWRTLVESLPVAVYAVDADGRITEYNEKAVELWGRAPQLDGEGERICGSMKIYSTDGEFMPHEECPMGRSLAVGDGVRGAEIVVERPDGTFATALANITVLHNDEGEMVGAVNCLLDITARKEAEEAVRRSEGLLRAVVETAVDGIVTIDEEGTIITFNPAATRIFGYEPAEIIGKNIRTLMPEPYRSGHTDYLGHYLETGEKKVIGIGREVQGRRKDGTVFSLDLGVSETVVGDKRVFTGLVRDITERKEAEEAVRRSEGLLRAVVETAVDGIITIDERGNIATFNPAATRIFGYEPEEIIGKNVKMLMPEPYHSEHDGYIENYANTGDKKVIGIGREVRGRRKNGEEFPLDLAVSETIMGETRTFTGLVRDISARKAAEEDAARLAAIVNHSDDAIISKTLDGIITSFNPGAEKMYGYRAEEVVGKPISILVPEDHMDELPGIMDRLRRGETITNYETVRRRKDGSLIDVNVTVSPTRTAEGALIGASAIARDVSIQKRAEEALRESEQRFRMMADSAPVLIWMSGPEKEGIYFNKVWLDFTGRSMDEELGAGWMESVHPDDVKMAGEICSNAFRDHVPFTMQFRMRRADGEYRWLLDHGIPRFGPDGALVGYIGSCIDITDRIEAEQALRISEERYRQVVSLLPAGVYVCARDGTITGYNRRAVELWGREPKLGDTDQRFCGALKLFLPDGTPLPHEDTPMAEALETGESRHDLEVGIERPDGSRITVLVNIAPLRDANGELIGAINCFQDISDRKQAEQMHLQLLAQIDSHRRRMDDMLATVPGIVWEAWGEPDAGNQRIDFVSEHVEAMVGYSVEEWLSTPNFWLEIVHPEDKERAAAEALAFYNSGIGGTSRFRWIRKDGRPIWVEAQSVVIHDENGDPIGMRGVTIDITARKEAEDTIASLTHRLELLLNSTREGIYGLDEAGTIIYANQAAADMLVCPVDDLVGRKMNTRIRTLRNDGESTLNADCPVLNALRSARGLDALELSFLTMNDLILPVECSLTPILQGGKLLGAVVVFRDISEKRMLEEERLRASKLQSVGVLAGGIAHDFNNILTAILGNVSLARVYGMVDERLSARLDAAEKACERAQDLTYQLLTFAKGGTPIKTDASLTELLKEAAGFAMQGSNVTCKHYIEGNLWAVRADVGQMSQVVQNLVLNSVQAMPDGGTIEVRASNTEMKPDTTMPLAPGKYVRVEITDEGVGIPHDQLSRIFDPFYTTKPSGTGLGLATAYSIMQKHGGHIAATSTEGKGATFVLYVPASESPAAAPASPGDEHLIIGRGKVLIMDDERSVLEMAGAGLESVGYSPVLASDGETALELYKTAMGNGKRFDVVVLDLTVAGGMGGKETVQKLLEIDPDVCAIVASGYSNDRVLAEYQKYGFKGRIGKPYTVSALAQAVSRAAGED